MGTGSIPGVKSGRGVTLTLHPLQVTWSRKSTAVPLLPLLYHRACTEPQCLYKGALYLFSFMPESLDKDKEFVRQIIFSDTSVFQVSGNLNSHAIVHYIRDSLEVNVFPGLTPDHLIRLFLCRSNCNIYQFV